jgi:hypothetical protein
MNGMSFFWKVRSNLPSEMYDEYNSVENPSTCINWEMTHGFLIPDLQELLFPTSYPELTVTERPPEVREAMAGTALPSEVLAKTVHPFDRFLAHGNEDACCGVLMVSGQEERVVAITDSGMVDPARPWMLVSDYLNLILAMAGEYGARYELCGWANLPPGPMVFDDQQLRSFRNDIFRPMSGA